MIMVLYSGYIVLWIISFVATGQVESEEASKDLYQKSMSISLGGTILMMPLIGYIADKIHWAINVILAFALRCTTGYLLLQVKDPNTILALMVLMLYVILTVFADTSIRKGYLRGISSEIRGTMVGLFNIFSSVGIVLFTIAAGYFHDKVGPVAPFELLLSLDGFYLMIVILVGLCGQLK